MKQHLFLLLIFRDEYMEDQRLQEIATASVLYIGLIVDSSSVKEFYVLLQAGFVIKCLVGTSIENLLYDQLKLNPQLVEEKISTIFLSGKPVDDIAAATLQDGSTLALSGAMPGLVGATLRRKSPLASFRQSISAHRDSKNFKQSEGHVQIKLFNILLEELGTFFLGKGIFIQKVMFAAFVGQLADGFYDKFRQILINNKPMELRSSAEWFSLIVNHDFVHLKVLTE